MGDMKIGTKLYGTLFAVVILASVAAVQSTREGKPVIRLALDAPVSTVQAKSSLHFPLEFMRGDPAFDRVEVPHILIYEDSTLMLRLPDAGGLRTLATNIATSPPHPQQGREPTVYAIGAYALPDYSTLSSVVKRMREIQAELSAQGFALNPRPWQSRFRADFKHSPAHLDTLNNLEAVFIDSAFFAEEANAFDMTKGRLRVEATIVNGRRRWGSRVDRTDSVQNPVETRAAKEIATMSKAELLAEPSYSLKISIGPTDAWMAQRVKDW